MSLPRKNLLLHVCTWAFSMKTATTTQVCVELVCVNTQPLSISTSLQTSHCPMSRKRNKARQNCLWSRLVEPARARAISVTARDCVRENIKQGVLCTLSAICYLFVAAQRSFTNGNVFLFFSTGQVQLIHLSKDMHSEFQTNIRSFLKLFPLVKAC